MKKRVCFFVILLILLAILSGVMLTFLPFQVAIGGHIGICLVGTIIALWCLIFKEDVKDQWKKEK